MGNNEQVSLSIGDRGHTLRCDDPWTRRWLEHAIMRFGPKQIQVFIDLHQRLAAQNGSIREHFEAWISTGPSRATKGFGDYVVYFMAYYSAQRALPRDCQAVEPLRSRLAKAVYDAMPRDSHQRTARLSEAYFATWIRHPGYLIAHDNVPGSGLPPQSIACGRCSASAHCRTLAHRDA